MTAEKILEIARLQLGIKENPPNSNRVKFNTAYYGQEVSGSAYPWCCAFVWWVFREAGAASLFYGGKKTASCSALLSFHKGQAVRGDYQPATILLSALLIPLAWSSWQIVPILSFLTSTAEKIRRMWVSARAGTGSTSPPSTATPPPPTRPTAAL